jgi:predicted DCC family thiol-disulfide oxidoreductase YuxK
MFDNAGAYVVYDGDCPFCSEYVKLLRLREAVGKVALVNARDDHPAVRYAIEKGVDLNQEMALILNGEVFSGPDCMHRLALMSTGAGPFNSVMARVFASPRLSRALYPLLRTGRNLTLRLMGRKPIAI